MKTVLTLATFSVVLLASPADAPSKGGVVREYEGTPHRLKDSPTVVYDLIARVSADIRRNIEKVIIEKGQRVKVIPRKD